MKVKVGKDLEGGSKKREEAGNDNPLASTPKPIFQNSERDVKVFHP